MADTKPNNRPAPAVGVGEPDPNAVIEGEDKDATSSE